MTRLTVRKSRNFTATKLSEYYITSTYELTRCLNGNFSRCKQPTTRAGSEYKSSRRLGQAQKRKQPQEQLKTASIPQTTDLQSKHLKLTLPVSPTLHHPIDRTGRAMRDCAASEVMTCINRMHAACLSGQESGSTSLEVGGQEKCHLSLRRPACGS
ncbi:hypothetical protein RRG08_048795 [Elysia crispata]|uniref:Uncharacterized protein n=1 Tax=Elysia crispata TaxID=231223 RepID=A0AAE1AP29_9GAST|nr:hypothetical protein RRG08_048795 [Elysia crispata]